MSSGATVSARAIRAEQAILRSMSGISGATRLVGILGWPVEHSLSPRMQNAAFAALGLDWAYVPLPAPPERLADALEGLVALGFVGANVTSPHKHAVARLCAPGTPLSVNTLLVRDGGIEGTSTDAAILAGLPAERPVVLGPDPQPVALLEGRPVDPEHRQVLAVRPGE